MPKSTEPYGETRRDAKKLWVRARDSLIDFVVGHFTGSLIVAAGSSLAAWALGIITLPAVAWVFGGAVILALLVPAFYATRVIKRQDAELRYAWIANKRLQQKQLEHEIATDNVILELMGERHTRRLPFRSVPSELPIRPGPSQAPLRRCRDARRCCGGCEGGPSHGRPATPPGAAEATRGRNRRVAGAGARTDP